MKNELDRLYFLACKSSTAANMLIEELLHLGRQTARHLLTKLMIYNVQFEDIEDYVLFVAQSILMKYTEDKGLFSDYASYVFNKRLTTKIVNLCQTYGKKMASLDAILEDGTPLIELIEDGKYPSIPDEISYKEFSRLMSSPKFEDGRITRLAKKCFTLIEEGYMPGEIVEILHITKGQYRTLKKYIDKELATIKNQMELK